MPQTQKSNGLRFGNFNCVVEMERETSFLSHYWLTECDGAKCYWNAHGVRLKCLSAQDFYNAFKTFFR